MALQRLLFEPGINKDATPTTGKGGWYDCDKVRFRNGMPEQIGGWVPLIPVKLLGTPRALLGWVALSGDNILGIGTNLKYYIEVGGQIADITPKRHESNADAAAMTTTNGSNKILITDTGHGALDGDFVEIINAPDVGGIPADDINKEHRVEFIDSASYYITVDTEATSDDTGGGGNMKFIYQTNIGLATYIMGLGWGADPWGSGGWGDPGTIGVGQQLVLWNHSNFGQTLLYGQRGQRLYKWDPSADAGGRGTPITGNHVPLAHDTLLVSDVSRFVVLFGTNDVYDTAHDPLLVRWSDQENYNEWEPLATNQAGSQRISHGSYIVTAIQTKQEVLFWTDSAIYSMQYVGPPWVWDIDIQMQNISIISPRAAETVSNMVFWMGKEKFYSYTGRVNTLPCPISAYIFSEMNEEQNWQVFAATNERFNEVWWFYCSKGSLEVDRYVIYNYVEDVWSHGTMERTAWVEAAGRPNPIATTQDGQILYHESGVDDVTADHSEPIESYIISSDIDIGEGDEYAFVWRMVPDISFVGSDGPSPTVKLRLLPRRNPGAAPLDKPMFDVQRTSDHPVEQFTEYVYTRVRGRQIAMQVECDKKGTHWRLGTPRVDVRADGRKT